MSLDGLLPSDRRVVVSGLSDPDGRVGYVTEAPAGGYLRVRIPSFGPGFESDPARYVAPAGLPVVGDACLVLHDDQGNPWALFAGAG